MSMQVEPVRDARSSLDVEFLMDPSNKTGFANLDNLDTSGKAPITTIVGKLLDIIVEVRLSAEAHTLKGVLAYKRLVDAYVVILTDRRIHSHPDEECNNNLNSALLELGPFIYSKPCPMSEADVKAAASDAAAKK